MSLSFFPNALESEVLDLDEASVDIIMRTKNRPELLARALSSVLAQDFKNWFLYLVNDGGDVGEVNSLLKEYEPFFNGRITVIHNLESVGMEAASNIGIKRGSSPFVVIHDDDDSWYPAFLQETVSFLAGTEGKKYVAVCTHSLFVVEKIDSSLVTRISEWPFNDHLSYIEAAVLLEENVLPPISLLFRRKIFDKIGFFNENLPVLGDWDFLIRMLSVGDIKVIPELLAYYHHRQQSSDQRLDNSTVAGKNSHKEYLMKISNAAWRQSIQNHDEKYAETIHQARTGADRMGIPNPRRWSHAWDREEDFNWRINNLQGKMETLIQHDKEIAKKLRELSQILASLVPNTEVSIIGNLSSDDESLEDLKVGIFEYDLDILNGPDGFDGDWYIRRNPDVVLAYANPLEHYLQSGAQEGRDPNRNFEINFYVSKYPEVKESGIEPLTHYLTIGKSKGFIPNSWTQEKKDKELKEESRSKKNL